MIINEYCLIRTYSAGVHFGTVASQNGKEVLLHNATRIWRWKGANSLSELSQKGADEEWTRISEVVPEILLMEAIEIIPCSLIAIENLGRSRWGN